MELYKNVNVCTKKLGYGNKNKLPIKICFLTCCLKRVKRIPRNFETCTFQFYCH